MEHAQGKIRHSFSLIPTIRYLVYTTLHNIKEFVEIPSNNLVEKLQENTRIWKHYCTTVPKCFLPRTSSALLPHACPVQKICKCMPSFLPYRKNYRVWVNESAGHYYSVVPSSSNSSYSHSLANVIRIFFWKITLPKIMLIKLYCSSLT